MFFLHVFVQQFSVNLSDEFLAIFLARFLTRFLARVLGRENNYKYTVQYYPA